jgi:hypothetical protein
VTDDQPPVEAPVVATPVAVLDLDVLRPPSRRVKIRDTEYLVPGDIPVPLIVKATQLQSQLADTSDERQQGELLSSLYTEVMALFRIERPDLPDLPLSMTELSLVLGYVISGAAPNTLEGAVTETIAPVVEGEGEPGADPTALTPTETAAA